MGEEGTEHMSVESNVYVDCTLKIFKSQMCLKYSLPPSGGF